MSSPPDPPELRPPATGYDPTAVARISIQAVPKAIRLGFLHADIDERKTTIPSDWSAHALMGFNSEADFDRGAKTLVVTCGFLAMYAPEADLATFENVPTPKEAPFELHASFRLGYELTDVALVQDGDPEQFAATNGVMHAWPYWREIAQSTTVRFGLAPLLVGTYKLPWSGDPKPEGTTREPD
jgi:hypothetical protein